MNEKEDFLEDQLRKANLKLKNERQLRTDLISQMRQLEASAAELERKYRAQLLVNPSQKAVTVYNDRLQQLIELGKCGGDAPAVKAQIMAYHSSLDKKGYDHVWRERLDVILRVLSTGEFSLPRALAKVRRVEERKRKMGLESYPWVINDQIVELPWRAAAAAYRSAVFEAVLDEIRPNTRKIIETGSGWGEHLCNIYLEGGPLDATYYACELEEEGRKCAQVLASLDPAFRLDTHFFDYCHPNWSGLPKDDEHTILLTAHSIEQVAEIHRDCLYGALELSKAVTGIHFEPIGWQTYPEAQWTDVSRNHYARCADKKYNTNLWPLLCEMRDAGLIVIERLATNFIGLDYNPATLIIWRKCA